MHSAVVTSINDAVGQGHAKCQTTITRTGHFCTGYPQSVAEECKHARAMARYRMCFPDHTTDDAVAALGQRAEFSNLTRCGDHCGDPSRDVKHVGNFTQCADRGCGPCWTARN